MQSVDQKKTVIHGWHIEKLIGEGSFGRVYSVVKKEYGGEEYTAALKHISIPRDEKEHEEGYINGFFSSEESAKKYYESKLVTIRAEIRMMYQFQGHTHIVSYQSHDVVEKENGGFDIYIVMEKLTPLPKAMKKKGGAQREDIIKIGLDICDALSFVHTKKTLHRDIKPENIFYHEDNEFYKLGDFGVSRVLGQAERVTIAGTPNYMAPEIYKHEEANRTADIYSLGIVLYRLANGNRAPFLPASKEENITREKEEEAFKKRLNGEAVPDIDGVDEPLMRVIQKACAAKPEDRFQSADEMANALRACEGDPTIIIPPSPKPVPEEPPKIEPPEQGEDSSKNKKSEDSREQEGKEPVSADEKLESNQKGKKNFFRKLSEKLRKNKKPEEKITPSPSRRIIRQRKSILQLQLPLLYYPRRKDPPTGPQFNDFASDYFQQQPNAVIPDPFQPGKSSFTYQGFDGNGSSWPYLHNLVGTNPQNSYGGESPFGTNSFNGVKGTNSLLGIGNWPEENGGNSSFYQQPSSSSYSSLNRSRRKKQKPESDIDNHWG